MIFAACDVAEQMTLGFVVRLDVSTQVLREDERLTAHSAALGTISMITEMVPELALAVALICMEVKTTLTEAYTSVESLCHRRHTYMVV